MKKKVTFVIISPTSGRQRRFSVSRVMICLLILLGVGLLGSGVLGAWKYRENTLLEKQCMLLEAEKAQLEAVNRTVSEIKRDEIAVRKLLGLESMDERPSQP
jgi:Tfp pilus assembly protein PilN